VPGADPGLIAALAQAETDAGQPDQALRRLEQLGTTLQAMGSAKVALQRLRLALALREADRSMTAGEIIGLQQVPADLLASLSQVFLAGERIDALRHILAVAGQGFLQTDAVLAAQVFLAIGTPRRRNSGATARRRKSPPGRNRRSRSRLWKSNWVASIVP
jgi:hypothetical protein